MCYTIDMRHSTQKGHENETTMDKCFSSDCVSLAYMFTCEIGEENGY